MFSELQNEKFYGDFHNRIVKTEIIIRLERMLINKWQSSSIQASLTILNANTNHIVCLLVLWIYGKTKNNKAMCNWGSKCIRLKMNYKNISLKLDLSNLAGWSQIFRNIPINIVAFVLWRGWI